MKFPSLTFAIFHQAKFKLTFWYAVIILLINTVISGLIYNRTTQVINQELQRIQLRVEEERKQFPMTFSSRQQLALENLEDTKERILWQLITINSGITVIVLVAGYILAGKL